MKLLDVLPIAFVAAVATVALVLDEKPSPRAAASEASAALPPARWVPASQSPQPAEPLLPSETLATNETLVTEPVPLALAPAIEPKRKTRARAAKKEKPRRTQPTRPVSTAAREVAARPQAPPRARIDVEARSLGPDQALQRAVIAAITTLPNLSGQIGVEAADSIVRLTGWTTTPGQSLRAEKAAARVDGVRAVVNEIRPRMGAITS
ncbi:MAG TPA: BON domain-containing protein [Usitatibacter sp.]|nr:BON domain-containing protein [Usitatibacter sp.]